MSQIIPLGIGSPAEIPQLVLTGLSPAVLPPPPTPGSGGEFQLITSGPAYSFNSFSSLIFTDGIEFTLPAYPVEVTWQSIYGTTPAIADIVVQVSLNGEDWTTVDESTAVAGEIRTFKTSASFIRAAMLDVTEGIITSVVFNIRRIDNSWY